MPPTPPRLHRAVADDGAIELIHRSQRRPDNRRGHSIRIAVKGRHIDRSLDCAMSPAPAHQR